jgi:FtsP/CotA-like multicopper oxidase with cupredoxin domain
MYTVHEGRRYRLKIHNASDDIHPPHLHRHSVELTRIAGKPTAGVIKGRGDAGRVRGSGI